MRKDERRVIFTPRELQSLVRHEPVLIVETNCESAPGGLASATRTVYTRGIADENTG
jgi:hypothetical protein